MFHLVAAFSNHRFMPDAPGRVRQLGNCPGRPRRNPGALQPSAATPGPAAATTGPAAPSLDDDQWVLALHGSQNVDEVAAIAANECRRLLGADRVSIAEQYGPRVKIQAVSGQQTVSARSNAMRLLSQLTEKVLATGEKLSFTGDTQKFPPQFEALLADYLLESRSRVIIILPVFGPKPTDQESQDKPEFEKHALSKPAPVGGIVIEQISESPLPADLDERLDRIGHHVGLALRNAQSRERVFLLSLWLFLGELEGPSQGPPADAGRRGAGRAGGDHLGARLRALGISRVRQRAA